MFDVAGVSHGHAFVTILLFRFVALRAFHARINNATDADAIPDPHFITDALGPALEELKQATGV